MTAHPSIAYLKPHELATLAVTFVESLNDLTPFDKQEVMAVANMLIEVEVRRYMREFERINGAKP
jgi:hypothetical protein